MEQEEILAKHETEGLYYIPDCVQAFYEYKYKSSDSKDLENEKALLEKAKRETAELKLAIMRGDLHLAADVEQALTNMVITFRNRILGIPSKLAPLLVARKDQGEIEGIIDDEIRVALMNLADYDPGMFGGDDNRDKDNRTVPENSSGSGTAGKNSSKRMGRSK